MTDLERILSQNPGLMEKHTIEEYENIQSGFDDSGIEETYESYKEVRLLSEVGDLQESYKKLLNENKLTKKAMCDLVVPFRDKYHLTDLQALQIARAELSIKEISDILKRSMTNESKS